MSFSYPTKWLIYLSLFEQGRQSPRKFQTQEEDQTWATPCSSKAHRGIRWFSSQPFNVPRHQGPVGQLFPSQQMKKALIPTLFNSVKGFWGSLRKALTLLLWDDGSPWPVTSQSKCVSHWKAKCLVMPWAACQGRLIAVHRGSNEMEACAEPHNTLQ